MAWAFTHMLANVAVSHAFAYAHKRQDGLPPPPSSAAAAAAARRAAGRRHRRPPALPRGRPAARWGPWRPCMACAHVP
eukprot:43895-Chlamydomonas_euryale.AAC.9